MIQQRCAFCRPFLIFEFRSWWVGGFRFVISDLVNSKIPNFVIGLADRLAPGALLASPPLTIYRIYNKVAERLPKTTTTFIRTCKTLLNKI